MKGAVVFDGNISEYKVDLSTKWLISAKKVKAASWRILKNTLRPSTKRILYLRADGKLYNILLLGSKYNREDLFVDNLLFTADIAFITSSILKNSST